MFWGIVPQRVYTIHRSLYTSKASVCALKVKFWSFVFTRCNSYIVKVLWKLSRDISYIFRSAYNGEKFRKAPNFQVHFWDTVYMPEYDRLINRVKAMTWHAYKFISFCFRKKSEKKTKTGRLFCFQNLSLFMNFVMISTLLHKFIISVKTLYTTFGKVLLRFKLERKESRVVSRRGQLCLCLCFGYCCIAYILHALSLILLIT